MISPPLAIVAGQPRREQIERSRAILETSQAVSFPYTTAVCGETFDVLEGVFSPSFFHSTEVFTSWLSQERLGHFLEVGSGIGATSILALKRNAASRVTALDISRDAVENTRRNGEQHNVASRLTCLESDVFSALPLAMRFDTIYWNLPFIFTGEDYEFRSVLERSLFDPGYRSTTQFLAGARAHLQPGGRVFAGFADFGDQPLFETLAAAHGLRSQLRLTADSTEGGPVRFEIRELHPFQHETASRLPTEK